MLRWLMGAVAGASAIVVACSTFGADGEGTPAVDGGSIDDAAKTPPDDETVDATPSLNCLDAGFEFCDRFERDIVKGSWDNPTEMGGGLLTISRKDFVSATRSLEVALPGSPNVSDPMRAHLSRPLPLKARLFRVAFSMRYDAIGADVQVVNIAFDQNMFIFLTVAKDSKGQAVLQASEQRLSDAGAPNSNPTTTVTVLTLKRWTRFDFIVDLAKKSMTLTRDDEDPVTQAPALTYSFPEARTLRVGAAYVAPLHLDNMSFGLDDLFYSAK